MFRYSAECLAARDVCETSVTDADHCWSRRGRGMQVPQRLWLGLCAVLLACSSSYGLPQCSGPAEYALLTGADDNQGHMSVTSVVSMMLSHVRYGANDAPPTIYLYVPPESMEHYRILFDCLLRQFKLERIPQVVLIPRNDEVCRSFSRPSDSEPFIRQCQFNFARFFPHLFLPCMPRYLFWVDADMLIIGNLTVGVEELLNQRDWMVAMKIGGRPTYGTFPLFPQEDRQTLQSLGVSMDARVPNAGLFVLDTHHWYAERGPEHVVNMTNQLRDSNFTGAKFTTMLSSQTPIGILTGGRWSDLLVDLPTFWNIHLPQHEGLNLAAAQARLHNTSIVLHCKGRAKPSMAALRTHKGRIGAFNQEWGKIVRSSILQQCLRLESLANVEWAKKLRG